MRLLVIRGAWGAVLLSAPRHVAGGAGGSAPRGLVPAVRVLGARHLAEAALLAAERAAEPPRWSVALDAVHCLSMVTLAAIAPSLRRAVVRSAAVSFALATLACFERRRTREGSN
jgi:hypothetical protein